MTDPTTLPELQALHFAGPVGAPKYLYLAGPVRGLDYQGCTNWRQWVIEQLPAGVIGLDPMRGKQYLRPYGIIQDAVPEFAMSTAEAIFARDRRDCCRADAVLVNFLGTEKVSVGTVMECTWAHEHHIPVIVAIEKEGNIHDHGMLRQTWSVRVETLEEATACAVAMVMDGDEMGDIIEGDN
jgi:nucleoside 2-deoxyribosyltransferase